MSQIVLALTKGRILKETLPLLARAGIEPLEDISNSRKLVFDTSVKGVQLAVMRGVDVPTYVQLGAADMGVVGKDILMENGEQGLYELLDLKIARCNLMTARPVNRAINSYRPRVATKFVNVARRYFAEQGRQVELIKLYGAMELAPKMDLADLIVDIVDTGNTLRANDMEPDELIAPVSSRLVVNRNAYKKKYSAVRGLLDDICAAVAAGQPA